MDTRDAQGDELALARYRYLLRTAPPETLEAVHREAFERLTPDQRRQVLEGLASEADPAEARLATDSPDDLARLATRAELRRPGTMERAFAGQQARGQGWGGFGGSFLGMLAGAFIGTSLASMLLPMDASAAELDSGARDAGAGDAGAGDADTGDAGGWDQGDGRVEGGDWGGDGGGIDDLGGFGDGGGFDIGF